MKEKTLVEKIEEAVDLLNEIDSIIERNPKEQSIVDSQLSDLYHLIENNDLTDTACVNVINKIREVRKRRRILSNQWTLATTYNTHKSKLSGKENRTFLLTEIHKTEKTLGVKYTNRVLTQEDIQELLEPKKKRGRPAKDKEELDEGEN